MKKILLIITLAFLVSGCYTFHMNDKPAGSATYANTTQDNIIIVEPYYSYNYYASDYYDWYIWSSSRFIFYPYYYSSMRFNSYWYWSYQYPYYYNDYYHYGYHNYYANENWRHKTRLHINHVRNIVFSDKPNNRTNHEVRNNVGQRNAPTTVRQKEIKNKYNETYRQKPPVKRNNEVIRQKEPVKRNIEVRTKPPVKRNNEVIRQKPPVKRNEGVKTTPPVKRNTETKNTRGKQK